MAEHQYQHTTGNDSKWQTTSEHSAWQNTPSYSYSEAYGQHHAADVAPPGVEPSDSTAPASYSYPDEAGYATHQSDHTQAMYGQQQYQYNDSTASNHYDGQGAQYGPSDDSYSQLDPQPTAKGYRKKGRGHLEDSSADNWEREKDREGAGGRRNRDRRSESRSRSRDRSDRDRWNRGEGDKRRRHDEGPGNRDQRSKRRRSRSKSRSRSGDRNNDDHDRNRRRRNDDDDREGGRYNPRSTIPSTTVMVRGLAPETSERELWDALGSFYPKSIRVIMNKQTGESRGFAFVDFGTLESSKSLMDAFGPTQRPLHLNGRDVLLDYSERRDQPGSRPPPRTDWICDTCQTQNFARRDACFKCGIPRSNNATLVPQEGYDFEPAEESTTLIVKGLNPMTEEDKLFDAFRGIAPAKSVRLIRDRVTNVSRCIAFIDFHSLEQAKYALEAGQGLTIDAAQVRISYSRPSNRPQGPRPSRGTVQSLTAAALEQAQWSRYSAQESDQPPSSGTDSMNQAPPKVTGPKKDWPPPFETAGAAFVYDSASGYYFEADSGFYYDATNKFYYNSYQQKYYKHTPETSPPFTECPAPQFSSTAENESASTGVDASSAGETTAAASEKKEAEPKKPLVFGLKLTASATKPKLLGVKKAAKDIAKWEKQQGIVKEESKPALKDQKGISPETAAVSALQPKKITVELPEVPFTTPATSVIAPQPSTTTLPPSKTRGTAGGKPVCLLCRRKFDSIEMIEKHEKLSQLHKDNVAKTIAIEKEKEAQQYRDRAEERRQMYGQDAAPKMIETRRDRELKCYQEAVELSKKQKENPSSADVPHADNPLGESNVGNKLLKMMGWKEGEGLGKRGTGITVPVAAERRVDDRAGVGVQAPSSAMPLSTAGSSYKDAVKKRAMERYEQGSTGSGTWMP